MNKTELIQTVAAKTGLTQKDTANALDAILTTIESAVASEDKVQIIGFGSFEARNRQARKGKNPSTGEEILIPASRVPAFKAGKAFKEVVAIKPETKGKKKK